MLMIDAQTVAYHYFLCSRQNMKVHVHWKHRSVHVNTSELITAAQLIAINPHRQQHSDQKWLRSCSFRKMLERHFKDTIY